ncbi:hypothetical protein, partial [Paenibacillus durus]|uniref:hypothetical protein n=1 Tax=Paenibacillus durus TaxID=44251 RepID=UPI001B8025A1
VEAGSKGRSRVHTRARRRKSGLIDDTVIPAKEIGGLPHMKDWPNAVSGLSKALVIRDSGPSRDSSLPRAPAQLVPWLIKSFRSIHSSGSTRAPAYTLVPSVQLPSPTRREFSYGRSEARVYSKAGCHNTASALARLA